MTTRLNSLNQSLDISGSTTQISNANIADEPLKLGLPVVNQDGLTATIVTVVSNMVTISGLTGMSSNSITRFITISNSANSGNNGTFPIKSFISSGTVIYENSLAVLPDANNGSIHWVEREPYSLQDDLNYIRADRSQIKGVNFSEDVPSYRRADAIDVDVPTNLLNISNKTLDAKVQIIDRKRTNVIISSGSGFFTITDTGNLPHSSGVNLTGIPLFYNQPYLGNYDACYVGIFDKSTGASLQSIADPTKRIFGLTRAGASLSPNTVEVELRYVTTGNDLTTSTLYTWETGQPSQIDIYYGIAIRQDLTDPWSNRIMLSNNMIGNPNIDVTQQVLDQFNRLVLENDGSLVYVGDGDLVLKD
jgi:hypothetical protein